MKKTLDKIKKYWVIYRENKKPIHGAIRLSWTAFKAHRKAGWKTAWKIAQGYFKLGLAWGGFKLPG